MGLIKTVKGIRRINDMRKNIEKKKKIKNAEKESEIDIFETADVYMLRMEEKIGLLGKRTFTITDQDGAVSYTAKRTEMLNRPRVTLYTAQDKEVGYVKPAFSTYNPVFCLSVSGKDYKMKQTTITNDLYELEDYGWQIQSQIGKTVVYDKNWTKVIQIEWEETTLRGGKRTDTYIVKMRNRKHQKEALLLALAIYISRRLDC